MKASTSIHNAHSDNLAFSLMARLHVILRRQNERVTDIEYMRIDPQYCRYVLNLARQLPNPDLLEICMKLEEVFFGERGLFAHPAAAKSFAQVVTVAKVEINLKPPADETVLPHLDQNSIVDQTYIGRLR